MSLDDLLVTLERRDIVTPVTSINPAGVTSKPAPTGTLTPDTSVTREKCSADDVVQNAGCETHATASQWWRFHYTERDPKESSFSPAATYAEAMAGEPDAIKAEPFEPLLRKPKAPLSQEEEAILLDWLRRIGETDEVMISAMLRQCQTDQGAREFFIGLAEQ